MLTAELDYELPPDRIATQPAEPRDAARLMVVHRADGRVEHRTVRELGLPPLPSEGEGRGEGLLRSSGQSAIRNQRSEDKDPHPTPLPQKGEGTGLLRPGDLLVFNQTKVLPAHFTATRSATGGKVEGLYLATPEALQPQHWQVMLEARGTLREGETLALAGEARLELLQRQGGGQWRVRLHSPLGTPALLDRIGTPPLPPYIRKARRALHQPEVQPADAQRYNTVFAAEPGSVAAPTAGLHFTPELLAALDPLGIRRAAVTLHIGLGTFAPVRTERLEDHSMHAEWMSVPAATLAALRAARQRGSRIIPVGTTSVRALESLPAELPVGDYAGLTRLFILPADPAAGRPGFAFRFTDALVTNFHLPRSTLLALVAALPGVGLDRLKAWYRLAIEQGYRFYSYGDAMMIV